MEAISTLNKTQLEILQMFKNELKEEELLEIKRLFTKFMAQKAASLANKVWDEKGWTNEDMKNMAQEHNRIASKR